MFPEENKKGVKLATNVSKSIEVKVLDTPMAEEIKKAMKEVEPLADGSKNIQINFVSTTGTVPVAISLLEAIHKSDVDCIAHCTGELDFASTIVLAGCKFLGRSSDATSMFNLFNVPEKAGKKRKTLTPEEENGLAILNKLTGKEKNTIKTLLLSGTKVTADKMKSLGLIDKIDGEFVDKYAQARLDAKNKK